MKGPKKSCYENGIFQLSLIFPKNYPNDPPDIKYIRFFIQIFRLIMV